ncbi:YDG domain-containing protein [Neorhodopirellula pilleata]|uniref:Heme/hemopexin-binding protein n=1 Tax=Neorhodopirellula pilleata TaxID=2714738 RepID=A0A5C6AHR8_9BACT|nr:YDG domain-containing protein [Neorhodopirellula pilleata]TWT98970.1 Heme/hemopexin-binding protein precursor [Neorhodopirellula pilleata]
MKKTSKEISSARSSHRTIRRLRARRHVLGLIVASSVFAGRDASAQLPTGADVIAGQASIVAAGNALDVNASTSRAIVNWDSFNVGAGNVANFNLPDANSAILNRVTSQNMPSTIAGTVQSNGNVYLVNPSGIVVSNSGMINTNGFTASTFDVADQDFMAGGAMAFSRNGSAGSIVNHGTIQTGVGGAHLIANEIANHGSITTTGGSITLSGGGEVTLNNGMTYVQPSMETLTNGISPTAGLINNTGQIRATGAATSGGEVYLVNPNGKILHNGTIAASRNDSSQDANSSRGGSVRIEADDITLASGSAIDVRGTHGGGTALIGGDWQGSGEMTQATSVTLQAGAVVDASATDSGDGGTIVLWSDITNPESITRAFGTLLARAGDLFGDGGKIETSGNQIDTNGIVVDAGALIGNGGLWLIDPYNYVIDAIAAGNIVSTLNTGTSVTVTTTANNASLGSSGNNTDLGDITLTSDIVTGAMSGDATLTMQAARHINIGGTVGIDATQNGNTAKLHVQLLADSDHSGDGINTVTGQGIKTNGGDLTFGDGSTAVIGGATVQVGGDLYVTGSVAQSIETGGGDITINGETIVANSSVAGLTFDSNGGNIEFGGVLNSGNQYTYVDGPDGQANSWDWARTNARNGTAGGAALGDSYLVTITSRLENAIAGIAADYRGAWIGAYRPDPAGSYNWQWVDGPEAGQTFFVQAGSGAGGGGTAQPGWYSNFGTGEPNGALDANGESRGQFFGDEGLWNDLSAGTTFLGTQDSIYSVLGYVRETNLASSAITINAGSGSVTFDGAVGGSKALASLTTTAGTGIQINGGEVNTTGIQTYNSPVLLGAHTNISTIQSDIIFNSTVDSNSAANPWNLTATITPGNTYYWIDWTSWDSETKTATGTITVGGDVITVEYHNPQGILYAQTSGGTNYWTGYQGATFSGASPYVSANVANGPSTSDIIQLQYGGSQTLTFSESIENLAFSIVSMNGNGYGFDQDFDIESYSGFNGAGPGYWGGGNLTKAIVGNTFQLNDGGVNGSSIGVYSEPHGTIRFGNAFSQLTWNSLSNEQWNGFTIGVSGTSSTAGSVQFNGAVGSTNPIGDLTVNAQVQTTADIAAAAAFDVTGLANLGGSITTTGRQSFGSAVTLGTDLSLTTTSNGEISATSTIDGSHALIINANGTGDVTLNGEVGATDALTALTVNTATNTGDVTLSKNQNVNGDLGVFGGDIVVGGNISKTTTSDTTVNLQASGAITVNSGVAIGAAGQTVDLMISNGTASNLNGVLAGNGSLTKNGSGFLRINTAQTYSGSTIINDGILMLGASNVIPDLSRLIVNTNGIFSLNSFNETVGSLEGDGLIENGSIVRDGIVLWLDAGNGASYSGTGTTWYDLSGNGYDGTLYGNPTYNAGQRQFELTSNAQYAQLGALPANFLSSGDGVLDGLTLFTVADFGSANIWERIVDFGNGSPGDNIILSRFGNTNAVNFELYPGTSGEQHKVDVTGANTLIPAGGGVRSYAGTADGTNLRLFANGGLQITTADTALPNEVVLNSNYIGKSNWTVDDTLRGSIGIVLVYDRALTGSEVQQNHAALIARSPATLTVGGNNLSTTFAGRIENGADTLNLAKIGSGTLTLTGENKYSGTTTINAGSLQIGNGGSSGTLGLGNVINNADLLFNRSDNITVANNISGTGDVEKVGANDLTLTGASTYTGSTAINNGDLTFQNNVAPTTSGFTGSGSVTIEPTSTSPFAVTKAYNFANTISEFTIGKQGNTANITVSAGQTVNGNVKIFGGDVALNGDLTSTATDANLLVKATGSITTNDGRTFSTNGGDITLWADSDATAGGQIIIGDFNSLLTQGGNITLAGGADVGGLPSGFAQAEATQLNGIRVDTDVLISSAGGDITMAGAGEATPTGQAVGVLVNSGQINSGSGKIAITGVSNDTTNGYSYGILLNQPSSTTLITSSNTTADAIRITGDASGSTTTGSSGILTYYSDGSGNAGTFIEATGVGGGISVIGKGTSNGSGSGGLVGDGIELNYTRILANGGPITLNGSTAATSGDPVGISFNRRGGTSTVVIGSAAGTAVPTSTSDITFTADALSIAAGLTVNTTGGLIVEPLGTSFTSALTWSPSNLSTLESLRLGKDGNTANITIGSNQVVSGNIEIYGGDIAINGGLNANGNTVLLQATGNVTQGPGSLSADKLLVVAPGTALLAHSLNAIGTFAFDGGGLTLNEIDGFTVGTVGSTNGINASGFVDVSTHTGDLMISQNIATTNSTVAAIVLNAGQGTAAGTSTGGNIVVIGSPSITTGTGGRATFYTGSIAGSTGLTDLIGSGSGNFRYNSDKAASNFSLPVGNGLFGIYREQPTINVSVSDATITYGDSTAALTPAVSGSVNGDGLSQIFASPSVTIGGTTSTSGNPIIGQHSLTSSGTTASQLGYAIGTSTGGMLTVNQKQITTPLVIDNKEYDGTTNASFTATANGAIVGDIMNIGGTATFTDKNVDAGKTVNIVGLELTGTDASNYTLANTTDTSTADITAKSIAVSGLTANNKIYDATTVATIDHTGVTLTGMIHGDDLTVSGTSGVFADKNVDTGKTVTLSGTTYGGVDVNNYTFVDQATTTADITQKSLTISGMSGIDREYDATTAATVDAIGAILTGLLDGDVVTIADVIGTFADKNAGENKTITITGSTLGGADLGNYSITNQPTATADITPKSLTISGLTAADKVYDATATAIVDDSGINFNGLLGGDTVSIDTLSGTFSDKNVGVGKTVTIATTYAGSDVNNYSITDQATTTASISPRAIAIQGVTADDKVYDSTTSATLSGTATADTFSGDDVSIQTNYIANFATKDVASGQTVTVTGFDLSGADASNYALSQPTGLSADITPAPLTVTANHDSKFVTKSDIAGYAGASFHGFVGNEGVGELGGALTITRVGVDEAAGTYSGVLSPGGLTSTNYAISFVEGDYTIVPAEQFLIRFGNSESTYGDAMSFGFLSAQYMDAGLTVTSLTPTVNGNQYAFNDGVGGSASFVIGLNSPTLSSSGHATTGSYGLTMGDLIASGGNFSNDINLIGSHTIHRAELIIGASGVSKVYDGNVAMNNLSLTLNGWLAGDSVTVSGQGSYEFRDVGTGLNYTVGNLALSGADADNYVLIGGTVFDGNDGVITPKHVTITAPTMTKVYDGNTNIAPTIDQLQNWTNQLGIDGDTFDGLTLTFDNKNVGVNKTLTPSSSIIDDGNGGANYVVNFEQSFDNVITRLNSVTWIGGANGDWNDPANWAGGAVPDLANVANVIIPHGVTPMFGSHVAGPVQLDSFSGGSLQLDGGVLDVFGLFQADTLTQNGGTLKASEMTITDFAQHGGGIEVGGDFTVTNTFAQDAGGTIDVGGLADITHHGGDLIVRHLNAGNASLNSPDGGTHLGNLNIDENLQINANGDVTQDPTGTLYVGQTTTIDAAGRIILDGSNNDFAGPVHLDGTEITIHDHHGGLVLGNVQTPGKLNVTTTNGDLTQTIDSRITVGDETQLNVDGDVHLRGKQNEFVGVVHVDARNAEIAQSVGDLILGTVRIVDHFWAESTKGKITQSSTATIEIGGDTSLKSQRPIELKNQSNRFGGPITVDAPLFDIQSVDPLTFIRTGVSLAGEVGARTNGETVRDSIVRPSNTNQDSTGTSQSNSAPTPWSDRTEDLLTSGLNRSIQDSTPNVLQPVHIDQSTNEVLIVDRSGLSEQDQ